jgi:hypothetical protein
LDDRTKYFGGRAQLWALEPKRDARGALLPFEVDCMPFVPRRVFVVADVPAGVARGGHAHRRGMQLLVCLQGRIEILMRCAGEDASLELLPWASGLLVGAGVWCRQTYAAAGSVLLVFASEDYDPASYLPGDG